MRYQRYALWLALRRQLQSKGFWLLFALLAVTALALRFGAQRDTGASIIQIGLVLPDGTEALRGLTSENGSSVIAFVITDEETAEREVASGRWDCALVLSEDFEEQLAHMDYDHLITVLASPSSIVAPMVRESATAALARRVAPDIAVSYLRKAGIDDEGLLAAAREKLAAGMSDEQRVHVLLETMNGEPLDEVNLTRLSRSRLARGTLAVVLLVWMLFCAVDLRRWFSMEPARRMRSCMPAAALLLPQMLSCLLPALFAGVLMLLACGEESLLCVTALTVYLIELGALSLLLALLLRSDSTVVLLIPIASVSCMLFSPVLFDITALYPELAPLSSVLPVTLYLRAGEGDVKALRELLAQVTLLAAAAAWI